MALLRCAPFMALMVLRAVAFVSPAVLPPQSLLHTNSSCPQGFKACGHCHCVPEADCDACRGPMVHDVHARNSTKVSSKMEGCPPENVDCGNYTCVPPTMCAEKGLLEAESTARRSKVPGCPEDFTDCGICACVPGNVCSRCPRIIAFSFTAGTSSAMSNETYNESGVQDTWDPALSAEPAEDRIWSQDGTASPVSWSRYTSTFPFLVALKAINRWGGRYHLCGGTLIRETHVLTAAHCFRKNGGWDKNAEDIEVWWGHGNNDWISSKVDLIVTPALFNEQQSWDHDVAVLRLSRRFAGAPRVRLSHRSSYALGSGALIAGWGMVNEAMTSMPIDKLKEAQKNIAATSHCHRFDSKFQGQNIICTTSWKSGIGKGDSGGPMLQNGYQIGICSHHFRRSGFSYFDAFTRVASYTDWIDGVLSHHP